MGKFKVAAIFSSNMVLQRQKNIRVFGEGEDGSQVTVSFLGETHKTIVKNGSWSLLLPPRSAGTGYTMTVTNVNSVSNVNSANVSSEEKIFENIAIGEVWLAGGQSNMEYELQNCTGGLDMLKDDKNPNVRFYYTPKNAYMDEKFYRQEEESSWQEFGEETAKNWSAVGYLFGKNIAAELGVTVGIIGCNWGGTSASCWMSEDSLREDRDLASYLEEYDKAIEGKSEEDQIREYKEYESYHSEWDKRSLEQMKINPELSWNELQELCGVCRWPGPKCCINPYRPSGLYHTMLQRVIPYTLRGFLYYQGESDDHKPAMYQKLLTRMIRNWREDWEDLTLPFLLVQLPMHRYKHDPDLKNWCLIREAQMDTFQTVKNTGIAVILDCGEFNEIHPKDKRPVGERLALQALYQVYQRINDSEAYGPIYDAYICKEGGMELSFLSAEDGLVIKGEVTGFEIAGDDMVFVPALAEVRDNKIFVSSPEVKNPIAARYCWTNYGEVSVFGRNGIPLAPFRTNRH